MIRRITQSKSKTFFAFCFCFLIGVGAIAILDKKIDLVYLYLSFFICLSLLGMVWQNKIPRFLLCGLIFFLLGVTRYLIAFPLTDNHISQKNGTNQMITGHVAVEPDVRSDGVRYIVKTDETAGKIYFKASLFPRYDYGDKLEINCSLETPEQIEDFRYDLFLARYGVFSLCQNPKIKKIGEGEGNMIFSHILNLKKVVAERMNRLWHEPHASFMAGLLYGYRGGLGSLNELFSRTGVTHIVAISGYNITILATILITCCVHLLIPRKKAFWLVTGGISLFVLFAGASASVVRAGIMGVVVLLAKQVGRTSRVGNVMMLTAVLMTLHNPFILMWDAGFQLSFISTLGLVYLTPLVRHPFEFIPAVFGLKESLISTMAAIVATLPLILFQFGRLSIVAPIVNVLILWIIPFLMLLGFLAVLTSFIFFPLGQVVAWLAWVGLTFIIVVVKWFAALPFAAIDFAIPVWAMFLLYGLMIFWVYNNKRPIRKNKSIINF